MPIKTKEEIFGDDGANGLQADIDLAAPTGYDTDNRAVGFGEGLTSAVGNRTGYALAENDEDLDARVAVLEVAGLDGAYSVGNVITKNSDAVTTNSSMVSAYDTDPANAHFRANALTDGVGGAAGFDFVGRRTLAGSTAGFLDRRVVVMATARTDLSGTGMAAVLNPGGSGATIARITSPRFFSASSQTDLVENYDLLEISGAGANSNVYIIADCTLADGRDAYLTRLDGGAPSFTADTACTVTVYRVAFWSRVAPGTNPAMVGFAGNNSILDLVPVSLDGSASTAGSRTALRVMSLRNNVLTEAMNIDDHGRVVSTLKPDGVSDLDRRLPIGSAGFVKQYTSYSGTDSAQGFVAWEAGNSATTRYDLLSLRRGATDASLTVQFDVNSPVTGVVEITAGTAAGWQYHVTPYATYGYISGTTASSGLYVVIATADTPDRLTLRRLGGAIPDNLPTSLTASMQMLYGQRIGAQPAFTVTDELTDPSVVPSNILSGDSVASSAALVLMQGHESGTALRCFSHGLSSNIIESAKIDRLGVSALGFATGSDSIVSGQISSSGSHRITGGSGTFLYDSARTATAEIPASDLIQHTSNAFPADLVWTLNDPTGEYLQSETSSSILTIGLNRYLPAGVTLTLVEVMVKPGAVRAGANRVTVDLYQNVYDWTTPASTTAGAAFFTLYDNGASTAVQVIQSAALTISMGAGQSTSSRLHIRSGSDGGTNKDRVYAVRLTYTYTTPGGLR